MAQETRVAPIEQDKMPVQILMQIAENKQQNERYRQQIAAEQAKYLRSIQEDEMKRRYENVKNFNTAIQDKSWHKETTDMYLGDLVKNFATLNLPSNEYLTNIGQAISRVSTYNKSVESVYQNADKFIEEKQAQTGNALDPVAANKFKQTYIQNSLFNPDNSQKTLEQLQQTSPNDILTQTYSSSKQNMFDLNKAYEKFTKLVKDAPEGSDKESERGQTGNVRSGSSVFVKWKPSFQKFENGVVSLRTDPSGLIENDVYSRLISDESIDALAISRATNFINNFNSVSKEDKIKFLGNNSKSLIKDFKDVDKDGIPDQLTMDDLDTIKRGVLTDYLRTQLPSNRQESNTETIIIDNSKDDKDSFIDVFKEITNVAVKGRKVQQSQGGKVIKTFGSSLNQLSPAAQGYLIDIANKSNTRTDKDGNKIAYTQGDLVINEESGKIGLYGYPAGNLIAPLDDMQTNGKTNLTARTKNNALNAAKDGIVITKDQFSKMSIPERQKFRANGGSIK